MALFGKKKLSIEDIISGIEVLSEDEKAQVLSAIQPTETVEESAVEETETTPESTACSEFAFIIAAGNTIYLRDLVLS